MTPISQYIEIAKVLGPSLMTACAVAISAGLVGVFVLLRREALIALAMPQVVAVGAAIGLRLQMRSSLPPALCAVIVALLLLVSSKRRGANNWLLPSIYIAGLAISFLIIANSGQHVAELQSKFTGIDVAVSIEEAKLAVPALLVTALVVALLWRRWLLLAQAPASAEVSGLNPARWDIGFLSLLSIVLLLGTNSLGAVMVTAMLFIPAATVLPWAQRIPAAMLGAIILAIVFLTGGLILSVENDWPLSQSAAGFGFVALIASHFIAAIRRSA